MKKTTKLLALVVFGISFTFTSCDPKDLLDVDFVQNLSKEIPMHIDKGQETLNESIVLNYTPDHLNKIKKVKITKLTYKIINFTGDPSGTIDADVYADNIFLGILDFNRKLELDNTTVFEVTDVDKLNEVAILLQDNKTLTIEIKGDSSAIDGAMDFKVEFTVVLEITANPL